MNNQEKWLKKQSHKKAVILRSKSSYLKLMFLKILKRFQLFRMVLYLSKLPLKQLQKPKHHKMMKILNQTKPPFQFHQHNRTARSLLIKILFSWSLVTSLAQAQNFKNKFARNMTMSNNIKKSSILPIN